MTVFRCGLPRENPFYNSEGPMDADFDGDVENPFADGSWMKTCKVCGAGASKKCGRCGKVWYCDREHQAFDWKKHKAMCGESVEEAVSEVRTNPENDFVFPEFGMEMERESVPTTLFEDMSDSENEEEEDEEEKQRRFSDFKKFLAQHNNEESAEGAGELPDDAEDSLPKDKAFERFNRLISRYPEQVLRYQRGGHPLPATDRAPAPPKPPKCELCGAERHFELQITPHLLSCLQVDAIGHSIDFASVFVYTCSSNCPIPDSGYSREFIFKQDFE